MVLGPVQSFTKENVKTRWFERYTSDSINKKFLGIPRGVYLGFVPSAVGLVLTLKTDKVLTFSNLAGSFAIDDVITGGTSGATAVARVVSAGYLLVDSVVGTFQDGETITSGPNSATLGVFIDEGISTARIVAENPSAPGTSEDMLDIFTRTDATLDFTGFPDGVYYVLVTATYQIGATSTAQIITRTTPEPDKAKEALICVVTKVGASLTIAAEAPATRDEPFAYDGQRIGFMPGGSIEAVLGAILTTQEVVASRRGSDGVIASAFDALNPQTTGLPNRLNRDLSKESMSSRLGKRLTTVRGNEYSVGAPTSQINISSSFSARSRDNRPVRDITNGALLTGVPVSIDADGSEDINLELVGVVGVFVVGDQITGSDSGALGIIQSISGTTLVINDLVGSFFDGEGITGTTAGPPTATISSIDLREGAVTSEESPSLAGDNLRNVVTIIDAATGRRPIDTNGDLIFGRLRFGPPGAGPVFDSGEIALTGTVNYVNANAAVTGAGTDFANEVQAGDIIEGEDGRFYTVDNVAGPTDLTLDPAKVYLGSTNSIANPRRRRFLVDIRVNSGGSEVSGTLPAGDYIVFFSVWFTSDLSNFDSKLDILAPGEQTLPIASESIRGIVQLAADGEIAAGKAVQATDTRLVFPLHGSTHVGNGSDPVPDATTTVSGLMPFADKEFLDSLEPMGRLVNGRWSCRFYTSAGDPTFLDGQPVDRGANAFRYPVYDGSVPSIYSNRGDTQVTLTVRLTMVVKFNDASTTLFVGLAGNFHQTVNFYLNNQPLALPVIAAPVGGIRREGTVTPSLLGFGINDGDDVQCDAVFHGHFQFALGFNWGHCALFTDLLTGGPGADRAWVSDGIP